MLIAARAIQECELMKLEDLAIIGDFIRFRANTNELSSRYMQSIKPVVIKSWESGAF